MIMKFTGTYTNLKKIGYTYKKTFGDNCKVYSKKISRYKFFVWVALGGYIEIDYMYQNTTNFISALKEIKWDEIEPVIYPHSKHKKVYIKYNHEYPEKGYRIDKHSIHVMKLIYAQNNNLDFAENLDLIDNYIYADFDKEVYVKEEDAKVILEEFKKLQQC